jgi:hypothetical protein
MAVADRHRRTQIADGLIDKFQAGSDCPHWCCIADHAGSPI